jgi:hypothetical protein
MIETQKHRLMTEPRRLTLCRSTEPGRRRESSPEMADLLALATWGVTSTGRKMRNLCADGEGGEQVGKTRENIFCNAPSHVRRAVVDNDAVDMDCTNSARNRMRFLGEYTDVVPVPAHQ